VSSQPTSPSGSFVHEALFYAGPKSFLDGTVPFLREGVARHEAILVVESVAKIEMLRSRLGGDADWILFADMAEVGANPARIIPAWQDFVSRHAGSGRRLRGIGEPIWKGRTPEELIECQRHESLLNVAFANGEPWYLLCPYDTDALPEDVIDEARRSHAFTTDGNQHDHSSSFRGVEESGAPFAAPLPEPRTQVERLDFSLDELIVVRTLAGRYATRSGLNTQQAFNFVMAINEVATNSVRCGGGKGSLRIWQEADTLVCEIADSGHYDLPLGDRERPNPWGAGPRGLWLANQLCALVQIRSVPDGTVIRLHMRRPNVHVLGLMN
jgi:anti-sigma regulatory factor (Ser/Thr protein kinase)